MWQASNPGVVKEYCAVDIIDHTLPSGLPPGIEGVQVFVGLMTNGVSDIEITIEDQIAEKSFVVTRWLFEATHSGEMMRIPATGKRLSMTGIVIHRIVEGKIVEVWGQDDEMGLMKQLGIIS